MSEFDTAKNTAADEAWKVDRQDRFYLGRPGGGLIFRKSEDETPRQARERDALTRAVKDEAARRRKQTERDQRRPRGKGRKPDPTPPGAKSDTPKAARARATPEQLAAAVEIPFLAPMLVARYIWQCEYCANNFKADAPAAAVDFTRFVIDTGNPYLLRLLEGWQQFLEAIMRAGKYPGLAQYAARPIVHHALPAEAAGLIGPFLGIPPRPDTGRRHEHPPARAETTDPRFAAAPGPDPAANAAGGPPPTKPPAAPPPPPVGMAEVLFRAQQVAEQTGIPIELAIRLAQGDPDAHRELAAMTAPPPPPPPAVNGNGSSEQDARQREIALMAEREQLRAQLAQQEAAEQMARRGGLQPNIPAYNARGGRGPGPQPPPIPEGHDPAGNPLPPEAFA